MTRAGNQADQVSSKNKYVLENADAQSSHGDSPVDVTPKDVNPDDATARDSRQRNLVSASPEEHKDAILDEAVELTFPASDPIAPSSVTKIVPNADKDNKAKRK